MRYVAPRAIVASLFLVFMSCVCLTSYSQQTSNAGISADGNNPLGPSGPGKSSDVWSLDPKTGSVHLQIPIGTIPQGGRGPKEQPIFQYNSSSTITLSAPMPATIGYDFYNNPRYSYAVGWQAPNYFYASANNTPPIGPWTFTYGPSLSYLTSDYTFTPPPDGDGGSSGVGTTCRTVSPSYVDEKGQVHDLNLSLTYMWDQEEVPYCNGGNYNGRTTGGTVDGSNISASVSGYVPGGVYLGTPSPGTLNPLLLPDGTQIKPTIPDLQYPKSTASIEDANGNVLSAAGVDSEGRTLASSPFSPGSVDLLAGSYAISTKSATNSAENYSISVSTPSFSGSFTMPHPTVADVNLYGVSVSQSPGPFTASEVSSITLPNSTAYVFSYDPTYGTISNVELPQGGHVRFVWGIRAVGTNAGNYQYTIAKESTIVATDVYVSDSSGTSGEKHWHYSYQDWDAVNGPLVTTQTAPDGTVSVITSMQFGYGNSSGMSIYTPQETRRQITDGTGNSVTIDTVYNGNGINVAGIVPTQITTTYQPGSVQKQVVIAYDSVLNPIEKDESDFYSCSGACTPPATPPTGWLRKTLTTYLWSNPNSSQPIFAKSYAQAHILNKPSQETITDGSGNMLAQTQYNYDETALSGSPGILNHDDANYPASMVGPRGNLTTEKYCSSIVSNACASWLSKTSTYDLTGMLISTKDFKGNATIYNYADAYVSGGPSAPTNAYPSSITSVSSPYIETYTYNYYMGSEASSTDWNGNTTTSAYLDPLNRITKVTYPPTLDGTTGTSGNQVISYTYADSSGGWSVRKDVLESLNGQTITSISTGDGLGRPKQTQQLLGSAVAAYQDTTYDSMGRIYTVSSPYLSQSDPTYGLTTYTYDLIGRKRSVVQPDGSTLGTSYLGNTTISTDEAGHAWTRASDGLGRLTSVTEPNGATTTYTYNARGDLMGVYQPGLAGDTPRTRSFSYDPLSRLLLSTNPESGPISYSYTSSGGLCSGDSTLPCSRTDANGMTITYTYDALNRMQSKFAPDGGYTQGTYTYDQGTNGVGRLTTIGASNNASGKTFTYDAMGRVTGGQWLDFWGRIWRNGMTVQYDLTGDTTQLTYPDGRIVSQTWDSAGRLASVADGPFNGGGSPYINGIQYAPTGVMTAATYGNGVSKALRQNNRLQPCRSMATTPLLPVNPNGGNLFDRQIFYGQTPETNCGNATANSGNIWHILENPGGTSSEDFTYDNLNRLRSAQSTNRPAATTYSHTYNIDSFGNMALQDNLHTPQSYSIDTATNRLLLNITDLQYNAGGELTSAPNPLGGSHIMAYTAEGYLDSIDHWQTGSYVYNALGERVTESRASNTSWNEPVYLNGQPMADLDNTGKWSDYIYANGQKIAKVDSSETRLHIQGTYAGAGSVSTWNLPTLPWAYQIKPHDRLVWKQYQTGIAGGGINLILDNVTLWVNYQLTDTDGQVMIHDGRYNQWHTRIVDLNAYATTHTIDYVQLSSDTNTVGGAWNVWYKDIAILSADGTITPLYTGQSTMSISGWTNDNPANQSQTVDVASTTPGGSALGVTDTAHYYLADHLGTTQMELSTGGWPVWEGQFTPFGQEIIAGATINTIGPQPADGTTMRYKFTGKERDAESGLDYFGARYYGSNMGRFTSSDWSSKPQPVPYASLANPQSLDLYTYGGNNPLTQIDADGHFATPWHFLLTFVAAIVTGHDPIHAFIWGVKSAAYDFQKGSQSGAPDAVHSHAEAADGESRDQASAAITEIVATEQANGQIGRSQHTRGDRHAKGHGPDHVWNPAPSGLGKLMGGLSFSEFLKHQFEDWLPSPAALFGALKDQIEGFRELDAGGGKTESPLPGSSPLPAFPRDGMPGCFGCFLPPGYSPRPPPPPIIIPDKFVMIR